MILIAAAAANLVSCLWTGNCTDLKPERIDDSTYYLHGHGRTIDDVRGPLLYQAASVTLEHGYDLMLVEPLGPKRKPKSYVRSAALTRSLPVGWYARQTVQSNVGTNPNWRPAVESLPTVTSISGEIVVSMFHRPLADSQMAAIDARALRELLRPFMDEQNRARMPELWKLVRQATVAHVRVELPKAEQLTPLRATPYVGTESPPELRDVAEFVDPFADIEGKLYERYEERRLSGAAGEGGTVSLSMTVTSEGRVSEVRVAQTTMTDASFVEEMRDMAGRFKFFREEVADTRVEEIPIRFIPRRD